MKSLTKKVLIIIASVIIMGLISAIPGFAETQEELKQIFVTRDEINLWINGSGSSTGISEVLANLEVNMQQQVQSKVKIEMSKRGIKDKTETTVAASS
ncbi:MAG: hypothetical protein IKP66_01400 [Lachnospiraceae bacterium]|nr:hypothetical protein [Lachnospiraceae bacterium]